MKTRKSAFILFSLLYFVAGCAAMDQKLPLPYEPVVNAAGWRGDLYLSVAGEGHMEPSREENRTMRLSGTGKKPSVRNKPYARNGAAAQWIIGYEKDPHGKRISIIANSIVSSNDLLLDAFKRELSAAGYTVKIVNRLPKDVGKGVELSRISVDSGQVTGLIATEGSCKVNLGVMLWKNGARSDRLDYESNAADFAIINRDLLLQATLQNAVQNVMKQAIPEVIRTLEH